MHTIHRFSASRVTMNAGQFWAVQAHVWVTSKILLVPLVCDRITLDTSFGRTLTPELIRSKKIFMKLLCFFFFFFFFLQWMKILSKASNSELTARQVRAEHQTQGKTSNSFLWQKRKHLLSIILFLSLTVFHIFSHLKKINSKFLCWKFYSPLVYKNFQHFNCKILKMRYFYKLKKNHINHNSSGYF